MRHKARVILWGALVLLVVVLAGLGLERSRQGRFAGLSGNEAAGAPAARIPIGHGTVIRTADPDASRAASELLEYLYSLSGNTEVNFVLSGQNVGSATDPPEDLERKHARYIAELGSRTGQQPVILGIDYGWEQTLSDYTSANAMLIAHWNQGGLVEISMSPGNPFTGGGLRDLSLGGQAYEAIFTGGTEANGRWLSDLDRIAAGLRQLQEAGVVVLWRPLHEMNGDWFWWSFGEGGRASREEYTRLWRHLFEYLTEEKDLHNLLWVFAPNGTLGEAAIRPVDVYYPGDAYVDLVGMDYYWDDMSLVNANGSYDALVAHGKPFGLSEVGAQSRSGFDNRKVLEAIDARYPQAVFVLYWHGWTSLGLLHTNRAIIENQHAVEFMQDARVITLERRVRQTWFGAADPR